MKSNSLPGPDNIYQATLDNGLRVFVLENHASPSVVINGYVAGGAVYEAAAQAGLASMTAAVMRRGTKTRSFEAINEQVEAVGASFSIYSGRHAIGIDGKALAEDFALLVDVVSDVLVNPVFPAEYVERVRGQRLTHLQERDNDTRSVASLLFRQAVYDGHPYSWPVDGLHETVAALTREDLTSYYQRNISPAGGAIVVVGAVTGDAVLRALEAGLGGWQAASLPAVQYPPVKPVPSVLRREQVLPGKVQTDIVLGGPAVRRSDPEYDAVRLANTVLGRFGMMGRLGENVREQHGLAYYAYSSVAASKEPGAWEVIAGVNPANVERCLEAVNEELARLANELVPEEELGDSKALLTGSLPLRLETNEGVADTILDMVWYELGLDYLHRYADMVNSVTAEQVRAVASDYLRPDAHVVAIAGPEAQM